MATVFVTLPDGKRLEAETTDVSPHLEAKVFSSQRLSANKTGKRPQLLLESRMPLALCA
ncbi:MAG: hypothetical protein NTX82_00965 [Candidatus Parcubacteria bacterium]|nr:hypothetical protein [Candidatus Parcubacteria bacterium]